MHSLNEYVKDESNLRDVDSSTVSESKVEESAPAAPSTSPASQENPAPSAESTPAATVDEPNRNSETTDVTPLVVDAVVVETSEVSLGDQPSSPKGYAPISNEKETVTEQPQGQTAENATPKAKPELTDIQKYAEGCCIIGYVPADSEYAECSQSVCNFLCFEYSLALCKHKNNKLHCIMGESAIVRVTESMPCNCYTQCCPLHLFCCHKEDIVNDFKQVEPAVVRVDKAAYDDVTVPCGGCCCNIQSCFFKIPECLGGYAHFTLLCLSSEYLHCQPIFCHEPTVPPSNTLCICYKGNFVVDSNNDPNVICKGITQNFCNETRCALPCDEDVPCTCFICPFLTAVVNFEIGFHFCMSVKELVSLHKNKVSGAETKAQ